MDTGKRIARFVRWQDWGPGKLTILWSLCFYFAVAYDLAFDKFVMTMVIFMIFATAQSAMGYVVNDWGDRDLDRRQFKYNGFNGMGKVEATLAFILTLLAAFLSGLPLILKPGFGILWFAWVAAAAAYSLEPLRLKTRGIAGLIVSFVSQWFLPVLLAFAAFQVAGGWDMWLIALALSISGATLEIGHQRWDRERDRITQAETFAVVVADHTLDQLYALALWLDKLAVGMIIFIAARAVYLSNVRWNIELAIFLAGTYLVLFLATLRSSFRSLDGRQVEDPYYSPRSDAPTFALLLHETTLNLFVPVVLGVIASLIDPLYGFVLALFLVWRLVLGGADILGPLRALRLWVAK